MRRKGRPGTSDLPCDIDDHLFGEPALLCRKRRCILRVQVDQGFDEVVKGLRLTGMFCCQIFLPVDPAPHELAVVQPLGQQDACHRQQHRRFRTGPGGQPVIGHAGCVGEARVHHRQLRPFHFALDDALRLRIKVVARFQVRADEQNETRIGMVRRGAIHAAPDVIAEARRGRADIGMAVVAIHTPRAQHALHVAVVPRASDMIHHLVTSPLDNRGTNLGGERIQHFIPGRALPLALTALADALQGVQDTFWIVDLVDSRGTFGAVAPATPRVERVALQLLDPPALLVHVGQQPARRLTIEADRGDDLVVPLHFARPRLRIVFHPIPPLLRWWTRGQVAYSHRLAAGSDMLFQGYLGHFSLLFE